MEDQIFRRRIINLLEHLRGISVMLLGVGFGLLSDVSCLSMDDGPGIGGFVFLLGALVGLFGLIVTARIPPLPKDK